MSVTIPLTYKGEVVEEMELPQKVAEEMISSYLSVKDESEEETFIKEETLFSFE